MDIERVFLTTLVLQNQVRAAVEAGISQDFFVADPVKTKSGAKDKRSLNGRVFDLCLEFQRVHNTAPTREVILHEYPEFAFDLGEPKPFEWIRDKLRERHMYNLMQDGMNRAASCLGQRNVVQARTIFDDLVRNLGIVSATGLEMSWIGTAATRWDKYRERKEKGGIIGIPFPWDGLNRATQGAKPGQLISILGREGLGKCVSLDSWITCVSGRFRLRDVLRGVGWDSVSLNEGPYSFRRSVIKQRIPSGIKPVYRVTTWTGRMLEVTKEHPLLPVQGWTSLSHLSVGESIAVPRRLPCGDLSVSSAEMTVLAGLLADGNMTRNEIGFTKKDPVIVQEMRFVVKQLGSRLIQRPSDEPCSWHIVGHREGSHNRNPVLTLVREWGLLGKKSPKKEIPPHVFGATPTSLKVFLRMLFSCDGSKTNEGVEYCSASEELARGVQHLLLNFGIISRLRFKPNEHAGAYIIQMFGADAKRFTESIGFLGRKDKERAWEKQVRNTNHDGIPFSPYVQEYFSTFTLNARKQVSKILGWKEPITLRRLTETAKVSRRVLTAMLRVNYDERVRQWLSPDIYWDTITSITYSGDKEVGDLGIENVHNFVANDILVHNSWIETILAQYWHWMGLRVALVSNEMGVEEICERLDASAAKLPFSDFLSGTLTPEEEDRYQVFLESLKTSIDLPILEPAGVQTEATYSGYIERYNLDVLLVDGGYLVDTGTKKDAMWESFLKFAGGFKRVLKAKRIPGAISSQLTAIARGLRGELLDAAFGPAIRATTDIGLGIFQDQEMAALTPPEMLLRSLKVRQGAGQRYERRIFWDFENMNFGEIPESDDVDHTEVRDDSSVEF